MGTISTGVGLISGLDFGSIVDQLISLEKRPANLLQRRIDQNIQIRDLLGTLSLKIVGSKLSVSKFIGSSAFRARIANSSSTDIIATASSGAPLGTFEFTPLQLLANHQVTSDQTFGSASVALDPAGKIDTLEINGRKIVIDETVDTLSSVVNKINKGQHVLDENTTVLDPDLNPFNTGSAGNIYVTVDGVTTPIALIAGEILDDTLSKINSAGAGVTALKIDKGGKNFSLRIVSDTLGSTGKVTITTDPGVSLAFSEVGPAQASGDVTASVFGDGVNFRLMLTSNTGGSAGAITYSNPDDIRFGLGTVGQDGTIALTFASELAPADDAKVDFGGVTLTNTSGNTFENVLPGLDIELTVVQSPVSKVTVTVSEDNASLFTVAKDFVDDFNEIKRFIGEQSFFDTDTFERGFLFGDHSVRFAEARLDSFTRKNFGQTGSSFKSLTQLGFSFTTEKTAGGSLINVLSFDESKFQQALQQDRAGVELFFNASVDKFRFNPVTGQVESRKEEVGFVGEFGKLVDSLTDTLGSITGRIDTLETTISSQNDRKDGLLERLEVKRAQMLRQFFAMESALANIQSQSQSLVQLRILAATTTAGQNLLF